MQFVTTVYSCIHKIYFDILFTRIFSKKFLELKIIYLQPLFLKIFLDKIKFEEQHKINNGKS